MFVMFVIDEFSNDLNFNLNLLYILWLLICVYVDFLECCVIRELEFNIFK